jgi:tetratricopeptide (TPR) repeat protein
MVSASRIALQGALLLGAGMAAVQPAGAQRPTPPSAAAQPARDFNLTKEERAAIAPLQAAVVARNWPAAMAALPTAQAGARGSDGRYIVARYQLQMALETQNAPMQGQAIEALIASGGVPAADMPALLGTQAGLATGDNKRAEAAFTRLLQADPNNVDALVTLAKIKDELRKPTEAATLLDRAIALREASGQRPPQSWYAYALRHAVDNKMPVPANRIARGMVASYPTPENWRDAILSYVDLARPGEPSGIDAWRLMRAAKALGGERDYLQFAQAADAAGLPAEAKAVLDEGVARRMVDPAKASFKELIVAAGKRAAAGRAGLAGKQSAALAAPTGAAALAAGDLYYSYGEYGTAATLYRAAVQKGGVDLGTANVRLGAALALAGQRAEAETVLRSVAGPGSDLAGLWLAWLRQPA